MRQQSDSRQVPFDSVAQLSRLRRRSFAHYLVTWLPAARWTDGLVAVLRYIHTHRRAPRLLKPLGLNEHLLLQKTSGILLDPLIQFVTDKEYAKIFIEAIVGPDFTPRTYAILKSDQEIDDYSFPETPCVVKPTHLSGEAIIVPQSSALVDRTTLKRWLREDYFRRSRESNYRNLNPKIIVEEFVSADQLTPPDDYKILCYNGHPKFIQVDSGRFNRHTRNLYDPAWNRLPVCFGFPGRDIADLRPDTLTEMLTIARRLSANFKLLRVDFYTVGTRLVVGELTNCPDGGHGKIRPDGADKSLGSMLK